MYNLDFLDSCDEIPLTSDKITYDLQKQTCEYERIIRRQEPRDDQNLVFWDSDGHGYQPLIGEDTFVVFQCPEEDVTYRLIQEDTYGKCSK